MLKSWGYGLNTFNLVSSIGARHLVTKVIILNWVICTVVTHKLGEQHSTTKVLFSKCFLWIEIKKKSYTTSILLPS